MVAGVFFIAIGIELVLQVAAFAVHRKRGTGGQVTSAEGLRRVLCVGDSFTYGMGATSRENAYLSHLSMMLNAAAPSSPEWSVINEGYPGRNSLQVLELLPALIEKHQPEVVIVVCGANDGWTGATEGDITKASLTAETPSFTWEYRTGRLIRILVHGRGAFESPSPGLDLIPPQSVVHAPDDPSPSGQLVKTVRESFQALDEGMALAALSELERMAAQTPSEIAVGIAFVEALNYAVISSAMSPEDAYEKSLPLLDAHADEFEFRFHHGGICYAGNRFVEARKNLDSAGDLLAELGGPHHFSGWFWRLRARVYSSTTDDGAVAAQPQEVADALIRGYAVERSYQKTLSSLEIASTVVDRELFETTLERIDIDEASRLDLRRVAAEVYGGSNRSDASQVTTANLRSMASYCRDRGIQFAIATYPGHGREPSPVSKLAGVSLAVAEVGRRFSDELDEGAKWADLFVADGHCTDQGYQVMAEEIFKTIAWPELLLETPAE